MFGGSGGSRGYHHYAGGLHFGGTKSTHQPKKLRLEWNTFFLEYVKALDKKEGDEITACSVSMTNFLENVAGGEQTPEDNRLFRDIYKQYRKILKCVPCVGDQQAFNEDLAYSVIVFVLKNKLTGVLEAALGKHEALKAKFEEVMANAVVDAVE